MKRKTWMSVMVVAAMLVAPVAAQKKNEKPDDRVRVIVLEPISDGDFADRSLLKRLDSAHDLWKAIESRHKRYMRLVDSVEEATVVIDILDRWITKDEEELVVKAQFAVKTVKGDYTREMEGRDEDWRGAAKRLADEIGIWVDLNRDKIVQK